MGYIALQKSENNHGCHIERSFQKYPKNNPKCPKMATEKGTKGTTSPMILWARDDDAKWTICRPLGIIKFENHYTTARK